MALVFRPYGALQLPNTKLKVDWSLAPRGLQACIVGNDWVDIAQGKNLNHYQFGSLPAPGGPTPMGNALLTDSGDHAGVQVQFNTANGGSMECWFLCTSASTAQCLVEFNDNDFAFGGGGGNSWPALSLNTSVLRIDFNNSGFTSFQASTSLVSGRMYHGCATWDGSGNTTLYLNGKSDGSTAGATIEAHATACAFTLGYSAALSSAQLSPIVLAACSNVAWTADEVMQRFLNPFGFLVPAEGEMSALFVSGGGSTTTLTAAEGSFTLTGEAVTFQIQDAAAQGAFTLTGEAAPLLIADAAAEGSFTLTGEAALFEQFLAAAEGPFALTGEAATLTWVLPGAAQGSFTLMGEAAPLQVGLAAAEGPFTLTGEAALDEQFLGAAVGSFTLTGEPVNFILPGSLVVASGAFTLTGEATLFEQFLAAAEGPFTLTGEAATLTRVLLGPAQGSFALTGEAALDEQFLACGAGSFALTGEPAGLAAVLPGLPAASGSFILTGFASIEVLSSGWGTWYGPATQWLPATKPASNWTVEAPPASSWSREN
jgi:Concanavalin A-like lectin/glucanases superfamily